MLKTKIIAKKFLGTLSPAYDIYNKLEADKNSVSAEELTLFFKSITVNDLTANKIILTKIINFNQQVCLLAQKYCPRDLAVYVLNLIEPKHLSHVVAWSKIYDLYQKNRANEILKDKLESFPLNMRLSPTQMKKDLNHIIKLLTKYHPGFDLKRAKLITVKQQISSEIPFIQTKGQFLLLLNKLFAVLGDLHSDIHGFENTLDLPLLFNANNIYFSRNTIFFNKGDQLISIGNKNIKELVEKAKQYSSAENKKSLLMQALSNVGKEQFLRNQGLLNNLDQVKITALRHGKKIRQLININQKPSPAKVTDSPIETSISLKTSIATLKIHYFLFGDDFKRSVSGFFKKATKAGVKKIFIDIRNCAGGNISGMETVLSHLSAWQYKYYGIYKTIPGAFTSYSFGCIQPRDLGEKFESEGREIIGNLEAVGWIKDGKTSNSFFKQSSQNINETLSPIYDIIYHEIPVEKRTHTFEDFMKKINYVLLKNNNYKLKNTRFKNCFLLPKDLAQAINIASPEILNNLYKNLEKAGFINRNIVTSKITKNPDVFMTKIEEFFTEWSKKPTTLLPTDRTNIINKCYSSFANKYNSAVEKGLFSGKTIVATSPYTLSSAAALATVLQDNGFATIVGESPGASPSYYCFPELFILSESKILAFISTNKAVRPFVDIEPQEALIPDQTVDLYPSFE